jgi:hypothetical protein
MPFTVQAVSQFEPSTMEGDDSSKYRDFIERVLVDDSFRGNRHVGLAAETGGEAARQIGTSRAESTAPVLKTVILQPNPSPPIYDR